jgi:hypothetical protein
MKLQSTALLQSNAVRSVELVTAPKNLNETSVHAEEDGTQLNFRRNAAKPSEAKPGREIVEQWMKHAVVF